MHIQHQNSQLSFQAISVIYKGKMSGVATAGETIPSHLPKDIMTAGFYSRIKTTPK